MVSLQKRLVRIIPNLTTGTPQLILVQIDVTVYNSTWYGCSLSDLPHPVLLNSTVTVTELLKYALTECFRICWFTSPAIIWQLLKMWQVSAGLQCWHLTYRSQTAKQTLVQSIPASETLFARQVRRVMYRYIGTVSVLRYCINTPYSVLKTFSKELQNSNPVASCTTGLFLLMGVCASVYGVYHF